MAIFALHYKDKAAIKGVTQLHQTLLPTSPVARLGTTFMEKFYYSRLLKDELIHCDYYRNRDVIVGFIVYTKDPSRFLTVGFQRNCFYLGALMILVFFQKPKRIIEVFRSWQLNKGFQQSKKEGAILSFGVLPEYRKHKFICDTGLRISHDLFDHAASFFRDEGYSTLGMLVEPDNKEALLFFHFYACTFRKISALRRPLIEVVCPIC